VTPGSRIADRVSSFVQAASGPPVPTTTTDPRRTAVVPAPRQRRATNGQKSTLCAAPRERRPRSPVPRQEWPDSRAEASPVAAPRELDGRRAQSAGLCRPTGTTVGTSRAAGPTGRFMAFGVARSRPTKMRPEVPHGRPGIAVPRECDARRPRISAPDAPPRSALAPGSFGRPAAFEPGSAPGPRPSQP
jgi:hypothetical protein